MNKPHINELPIEVIEHILFLCNFNTILRFSATCKTNYKFKSLFKKKIIHEFTIYLSTINIIDIDNVIILLKVSKVLNQLPLLDNRDNSMKRGIRFIDTLHKANDKLQEQNIRINTYTSPHLDYFCGQIQPSDDRMRYLKRFLSKVYNKNIDYSNPMLMSIQHGIAIYDINMPMFYLNIILDLIRDNHIGIVFADTSINIHLDMPFRIII